MLGPKEVLLLRAGSPAPTLVAAGAVAPFSGRLGREGGEWPSTMGCPPLPAPLPRLSLATVGNCPFSSCAPAAPIYILGHLLYQPVV